MVAVNDAMVENNFRDICDRAFKGEVFVISRHDDENVVMVSERNYTELERIKKNNEYIERIDRAIAQKEAGTMREHELIEA